MIGAAKYGANCRTGGCALTFTGFFSAVRCRDWLPGPVKKKTKLNVQYYSNPYHLYEK